MISAPNLRLLLNGNKRPLFLLLTLALLLSSCNSLKKAKRDKKVVETGEELDEIKGKRKWNPETGKFEHVTEVTEKMDTVAWKDLPEDKYPPIASSPASGSEDPSLLPPGEHGTRLFDSYNVAVLLPFLTDKFNEFDNAIYSKSILSVNFYAGMQLAFDQLKEEGLSLNISVMDTKASETEVDQLLTRSELLDANMIIGPIRSGNVRKVAEFAKLTKKVLISPISPSSGLSEKNSSYVQVNPSLKSHCEGITRHIRDRFPSDKVVLVCRNKKAEIERLKFFQDANYLFEGSMEADRFKEFIVTDESSDFAEMDVTPYIPEGDTTIFVVPSWSNESFVYSFLRKVNIAKQNSYVEVYGMPQWMTYDRISYDYYEQMKVHVSSSFFLDSDDPEITKFNQTFFNRFGVVPEKEAYVGYDAMLYFGRMIQKHGTRFQYFLEQNPGDYLHTRFAFQPIHTLPLDTGEEIESKMDQFENKHVNILVFKDYYFQLAK